MVKRFGKQIFRVLVLMILGTLLRLPAVQAEAKPYRPMVLPVHEPDPVTAESDPVRYAAVSADGKTAVYTSRRDQFEDLWIRSADPAVFTLPRRLTEDPSAEFHPVFSPDSRLIAYVGTGHDVKGDIFLLDISGPNAEPVRLTGRDTIDGGPAFSPDGKTLYFHQAKPGQPESRLVALDLKNRQRPPRVLETGGDAAFPAVSPDGTQLAFVTRRNDENGDIFLLDLKTGAVRPATDGPFIDADPAWSPDGDSLFFSRIAVDTNRDGNLTRKDNAAVYRLDIRSPGFRTHPVTPAGFSASQPFVAAGRLFFLSNRGGVDNYWSLPATGTIPVQPTAAAQFDLAESISRKVPFDPYLTVLAFHAVLERFADAVPLAAKAAHEIGNIYQRAGLNRAAERAYQRVGRNFSHVQPYAALSLIRQKVIETRRRIQGTDEPARKPEMVRAALDTLDRISRGKSLTVAARAAIEKARLLLDVSGETASMQKALALMDTILAGARLEKPLAAEALVLKADIYSRIGRSDQVTPIYRSVVTRYPDVARWTDTAVKRILDLAMAEIPESALEKRISKLRKIADKNRESAPVLAMGALNRVGDLLYAADDSSRAKAAYAEVLDRFSIRNTQTAAARLALAEIFYKEERFRRALDLYETEIASRSYEDPIYRLARAGFIRKSVAAGEFLFRYGEIPAARKRFKSLTAYDDTIVEAHRGTIKCAAAMGDIRPVLAAYRRRVDENPSDPVALYATALSLTYLEDRAALTEARTLLERAIRINGRIPYFHQTLGYVLEVLETVHHEKGMLEPALESFQKAFFLINPETHPADAAHLLLNLGNVHYLLGRYPKAFEYYTRRQNTGVPFDNPNTEILFYRRLGASGFQVHETEKTISAYTRALELIKARTDPRGAARIMDRIHRYVMDRIVAPASKQPGLQKKAKAVAGVQTKIHRRLSRLMDTIFPPPSPQWTRAKQAIESLLDAQTRQNPAVASLAGKIKDFDITAEDAEQTLAAMMQAAKDALAFPERLVELKAEVLDRLGLAYQDAGQWEKAAATYEKVFRLNQRLGLNRNLARNIRSVAYSKYMLAASRSGKARRKLLDQAAADFARAVDFVDRFGVPEHEAKKDSGLVSLSLQLSLDRTDTTRAARGFSATQEKRLAQTFLYRIALETGQLDSAEKAIEAQLAQYPPDRPVPDRDRYGVSLLAHRAGLIAAARHQPIKAFDRFSRSADLCLALKNPVSTSINVGNAAASARKIPLDAPGRPDRLNRLAVLDHRTTTLLAESPPAAGIPVAAQYHNTMGVHWLALATDLPGKPVGNTVQQVRYLQRAGFHFHRGLRLLGQNTVRPNRDTLGLLAALHLNLAETARILGDTETAGNHFKKALQHAESGMLDDLKWRALAGLGRLDEALETAESVTFIRAGCGAGEIVSAFSPLVSATVARGDFEDAFNLAERISDLERYHRTAFLIRNAAQTGTALWRGLYPRLERIRRLDRQRSDATGEKKAYLEKRLEQERALVRQKIGAHDEKLPELVRSLADLRQREQVLMLFGLAARAEETAEKLARATVSDSPAKGDTVSGLQSEYRDLIRRYREIREAAMDLRPEEKPADLFTLFGPEPFEAMDVMEALPEKGRLTRLFRAPAPDGKDWIVFTVTPEALTVERKSSPAAAISDQRSGNTGAWYMACEDPRNLPEIAGTAIVLNGSHLVRAVLNRKPFKRKLLFRPAAAQTFDQYDMLRADMGNDPVPRFNFQISTAQTLVLTGPVNRSLTVPTRAGEHATSFLAATVENHRQVPLEKMLVAAADLSLALLPGASMADAPVIGHLLSIFGCPSVLIPEHPVTPQRFVKKFLDAYTETSALAAMAQARVDTAGQPRWILLGYSGMSRTEAEAFAAENFSRFVEKGVAAYQNRNYLKALSHFENSIQIARQTVRFYRHLPALYRLGRESAFNSGFIEKAADFAESLVAHLEREAPDTEAHADALLRLGLIRARLHQYEKAVPLLEEAVDMLADLDLGAKRIDALSDLGVVLENASDYERALGQFESAATLSRNLDKNERLARQHEHIGRILDLRMSRYGPAIRHYRKALEMYTDRPVRAAQTLLDLGRCYRLLGNFAAADRHYRNGLARIEHLPEEFSIRGKIIMEQANNAWFQARYEEAFRLQRKALEIARRHGLPLLEINALNTAGLIWWTLGDNRRALEELEKGLAAARRFGKRRDEIATTLNNLGLIYRETGRYEDALKAFDQALAIDREIKSRWAVAYDLRNQGMTWLKMERPDRAIPLLLEAVETAQRIGNRINAAKSWLALADAYFSAENFPDAESAYRKALDLAKGMVLPETRWRALFGMARLRLATDPETAEKLLFEAVDIIEKMRTEIRIEQLKNSFIGNKLMVYETLVSLLADRGKIVQSFETAERSRARNFIDLLGNQRLSLNRAVDQVRYDRHGVLRSRIAEHEQLLAQAADAEEREIYRRALNDLHSELADLMLEIQADNPQLSALVSVKPITANRLLKIVEPGVALLSYYVLPHELFCWVIRPDGIRLFRTPWNRTALGREILDYRRAIQNLEPVEDLSTNLYRRLLAPVMPVLGDIKFLGIIPHGPLHYLSFATLYDSPDFLIDRFSLFYLPSAGVLDYTLKRRKTDKKNLNVLAIGNPDLGDPVLDLPFAEQEVRSIQWNFPRVTVLTRKRATEDWVTENISRFGIIHLASHGEFNPINPLFSALKLTQGKNRDGDLEAAEVFGLDIHADAVVLSACQTGLGKITDGDDVIGLNRAFFYAGTHTVISSLWRVSDTATAILIKQFYRGYATHTKADALRRAIRHVKQDYPHPGYWGAFTLVGDYD